MFVNSKLIKEELTITSAVTLAAGTGAGSASQLVAMDKHTKYLAAVSLNAVTTAGNLVVTVWESTASAWASAVATEVTSARTTVSLVTGSNAVAQVEVNGDVFNKPYVGIYVSKTSDTASILSALILRAGARYGNM